MFQHDALSLYALTCALLNISRQTCGKAACQVGQLQAKSASRPGKSQALGQADQPGSRPARKSTGQAVEPGSRPARCSGQGRRVGNGEGKVM